MDNTLPVKFRGKTVGVMSVNGEGLISGEIDLSRLSSLEKMDLEWVDWSRYFVLDVKSEED